MSYQPKEKPTAKSTVSLEIMQGNSIRAIGKVLLSLGYIITVIRANSKIPLLKDWPHKQVTAEMCEIYGDENGAGIVCGVGDNPIIAVDIDIYDEECVKEIATEIADRALAVPMRQGKAPKLLLVFRGEKGASFPKITSPYYEKEGDPYQHRVEFLGTGQQFVAKGIHPDTGKPYQWLEPAGDITKWPVSNLPPIDADEIREILAIVDRVMRAHGYTPKVNNSLPNTSAKQLSDLELVEANTPIEGYTLDQAKEDIADINADDYDIWLMVGMALHHQFEGDPEAFELFNEWSATSEKYAGVEQCQEKWDSFGQSRGASARAVTMRSIIKMANKNREQAREEKDREAARYKIGALKLAESKEEVFAIIARANIDTPELRGEFMHTAASRLTALGAQVRFLDIAAAMPPMIFKPYPLTELGNAQRMRDLFYDHLLYSFEQDTWYEWGSPHWQRCNVLTVQQYAIQTLFNLEKLGAATEDESLQKFAKASQTERMVNNMTRLLAREIQIARTSAELNRDTDLFACVDKVVDLKTGAVREPHQKMLITRHSSVPFDPKADCPIWKETVSSAMDGKEHMVRFLQRAMGYSMLGKPIESVVFIPYGNGSNGKSTILNIFAEIMGDYGITTPADVFMVKGGGASASAPNEALLRFEGKRFALAMEMSEDSVLQEGLIKAMTGGESVVARGVYSRHSVEIRPTWAIWMPTNHRPIIKGQDFAIWRRVLLIPFLVCFDGQKKDPNRMEKLRAELPGILNWLFEGVRMYLTEGLNPPEEVLIAREEYKEDMDITAGWLEECCEFGEEYTAATRDLFASWQRYANERGEAGYIGSARKLGRMLTSKGFKPCRDVNGVRDARGFKGIRLKPLDLTNGDAASFSVVSDNDA